MRRLLEEPRWSLEKCTDLGGFPWDVVSTEGQRLEREVVSGADLEPLQVAECADDSHCSSRKGDVCYRG